MTYEIILSIAALEHQGVAIDMLHSCRTFGLYRTLEETIIRITSPHTTKESLMMKTNDVFPKTTRNSSEHN